MISLSFLLFCALGLFMAMFAGGGAGKRPWFVPAVGALVLFALVAAGLLVSLFALARPSYVEVQVPSPHVVFDQVNGVTRQVVESSPNFVSYSSDNGHAFASSANWFRMLILLVLIASLVAMFGRRGASSAGGFRRIGRVVAAVILIGLLFLGTVRTQYSISQNHEAEVATLAEMDHFDAPRIPVAPNAPTAPSPRTVAVQPSVATKASKGKSPKAADASNSKHKKSEKPPAADDTKQAKLVEQSSTSDKAFGAGEKSTSEDKQVMVAEAESDTAKTRPAWIDEAPKRTGNTRREVISAGPYATIDECYQSADVYLLLKAYERMQQLTGRPSSEGPLPSLTFRNGAILADGKLMSYGRGNSYWDEPDPRLQQLNNMGITADYLRREIVAKDSKTNETREYVDTIDSTIGPMKTLYLQIEFTPAVDRDLLRVWNTHERRERFAIVGVGAGSLLGLVGLVFGLLKVDTWTKGYYTKRLFIGVPVAIITGFFLLTMLGYQTHLIR